MSSYQHVRASMRRRGPGLKDPSKLRPMMRSSRQRLDSAQHIHVMNSKVDHTLQTAVLVTYPLLTLALLRLSLLSLPILSSASPICACSMLGRLRNNWVYLRAVICVH